MYNRLARFQNLKFMGQHHVTFRVKSIKKWQKTGQNFLFKGWSIEKNAMCTCSLLNSKFSEQLICKPVDKCAKFENKNLISEQNILCCGYTQKIRLNEIVSSDHQNICLN